MASLEVEYSMRWRVCVGNITHDDYWVVGGVPLPSQMLDFFRLTIITNRILQANLSNVFSPISSPSSSGR